MAEQTLISEIPSAAQPATEKALKESSGSLFHGDPVKINVFRFLFIYFVIQAIPLNWQFYYQLFTIDWSNLYYGDLFELSRYYPQFFSSYSFFDWLIVALIAVAGTVVWQYIDRSDTDYDMLYYWLRAIVRYRLAIAVIAYGFIKVFPLQAPYPTLSNLNTNYGDFTTWKMFSLSLGAAPGYEIFLGIVEVTGGLLLLYRRTATIGAFLILTYIGNVFLVNLAYEGGEYMYSLYLVSFALFLLVFDAQRLFNLVFLGKPTKPNQFTPSFGGLKKNRRLILKGSFLFLIALYGYKTYVGYKYNPHNVPVKAGLSGVAGLYNVTEFSINGGIIPYSTKDPIRWKDVVFEEWATLSIRSNRKVNTVTASTEVIAKSDSEKIYEFQGTIGRHYYSYDADTINNVLLLKNRNSNYKDEVLRLHYKRTSPTQIVLDGINERGDTIHVVLDKIDKEYLFQLGRSKPLKR